MATKSNKSSESKAVEEFKHALDEKGRIATFAEKMVDLPPEVDPPLLGSRMRIWKQDPSVTGIELPRTVYIHTLVDDGPKDSQIAIKGLPPVVPDVNRDFLINPSSEEAFDAVHTYAVVRQVLTMYQRVLGEKLNWQWNKDGNEEVLQVYPHAGVAENAFYSRNERVLKFFFFNPRRQPVGTPKVFTCRSLDIVAHEVGHAVLDSLKPKWLESAKAQTGGLHESFGDLTSIFLILSQLDLVEYIVAQTKADLHRKSILTALAEQFGLGLDPNMFPNGLRNADNDLKLSEVSPEVHAVSQVFTGAVFDILADVFAANRKPRFRDDAEVLYEAGKYMTSLTIRAFIAAPDENASFADVGKKMIEIVKADGHENYAHFIEKHFTVREVLGVHTFAGVDLSDLGIPANRCGCCGTMQRPEYLQFLQR
jgi:hypothetical protein